MWLFRPRRVAHAHCDLPCGVYDPAQARLEAEALNALADKAFNARSEAREAFGAYRATYAIAAQYEREVLPLRETISAGARP